MLIVDKMWKSYQSQVRRDLRTPISTLKISIKDLLLTNDVDWIRSFLYHLELVDRRSASTKEACRLVIIKSIPVPP